MNDSPFDRRLRTALRARPAPPASAADGPAGRPGTGDCLSAETLAAWVDDALDAKQRSLAEAHAASCSKCQATLAALIRTTPDTGAPGAPSASWWRLPAIGWLVPLAAAATAVLVWVVVPRQAVQPPAVPDATVAGRGDADRAATGRVLSQPAAPAAEAAKGAPAAAPPPSQTISSPSGSELAIARARPVPQPPVSDLSRKDGRADKEANQTDAKHAAPVDSLQASARDEQVSTERFKAVVTREAASNNAAPAPPAEKPKGEATAPEKAPRATGNAQAAADLVTQASTPAQAAAPATAPAGARAASRDSSAAAGEPARRADDARAGRLAESLRVRAAADIVSPDSKSRWRIAAAGAIQRSVDGGVSWQTQQTGVSVTLTAGSSPAPLVCWVVGPGGRVVVTTDGRSWRRVSLSEAATLVSVRAMDDRTATVTSSDGRSFSTSDGGLHWTPRTP
jgi:hypothetical protein